MSVDTVYTASNDLLIKKVVNQSSEIVCLSYQHSCVIYFSANRELPEKFCLLKIRLKDHKFWILKN